jgi:hypothetical protein
VTIDATRCQTALVEQIVRQGGEYLLAVKGNQASLPEAVRDFFDTARDHQFAGLAHSFAETVDAGHGSIETRRISHSLIRAHRHQKPTPPDLSGRSFKLLTRIASGSSPFVILPKAAAHEHYPLHLFRKPIY